MNLNFNSNKLMQRMFRKADGVVWDLMTGKVGVVTSEGIASLEGTPDEDGNGVSININIMEEFGVALPAFAQSTPVDAVKQGDIIMRGERSSIAWVIAKNAEKNSFKLMKPNGETTAWVAPKVTMLGFDSGVMVLRSLVNMLPGGENGLNDLKGSLMPFMMSGMLDGDSLDSMLPLMLMTQQGGSGGMGNMMQTMLMMKMLGGKGGLSGLGFGGNKTFKE